MKKKYVFPLLTFYFRLFLVILHAKLGIVWTVQKFQHLANSD